MKNVMNDLNETAELMGSADYKERFRAEYWQTLIRYERLKHFCCKIKASELYGVKGETKHDCPYDLLREQQEVMGQYLHLLEMRAIIEGIDL